MIHCLQASNGRTFLFYVYFYDIDHITALIPRFIACKSYLVNPSQCKITEAHLIYNFVIREAKNKFSSSYILYLLFLIFFKILYVLISIQLMLLKAIYRIIKFSLFNEKAFFKLKLIYFFNKKNLNFYKSRHVFRRYLNSFSNVCLDSFKEYTENLILIGIQYK